MAKTNPYCLLSDSQLLDLLKSGEDSAFTEIYERYWDAMYGHVLRMLNSKENASDIVQEVFTYLWTESANISNSTNLSGYLYVITRNKVLNLITQNKTRRTHLLSLARFATEMSNATMEQLNEKDLTFLVEKEIQNLPKKMREIFELSRKQDFSHKEIARRFDISDKTVKKQISNAIKIIKLRLTTLTEGLH